MRGHAERDRSAEAGPPTSLPTAHFLIGRRMIDAVMTDRHTALLDAIAVHDSIDLTDVLPSPIHLDYAADLLERCYALSLDLWLDVDREEFARLARGLMLGRAMSPADAAAFKDIRARAKQLRFVYGTLGIRHVYPVGLDRLTRLMGQAQDAVKGRRRAKAAIRGALIYLRLVRGRSALRMRELMTFTPTTSAGFRAFAKREIEGIQGALDNPDVTNKSFHDIRKVVSRLVAFYDTLTVLQPSEYHDAVDRYLSTINGLMGTMHDGMALRKAVSRQDYHGKRERLPKDIADRLQSLVHAFRFA